MTLSTCLKLKGRLIHCTVKEQLFLEMIADDVFYMFEVEGRLRHCPVSSFDAGCVDVMQRGW